MEEFVYGTKELSPDAVSVSVLDNFVLRVRFSNGEQRDFDFKPLLDRKCYYALKDEALFATARVEYGVISWANGLDIDPEWLYEDSIPSSL